MHLIFLRNNRCQFLIEFRFFGLNLFWYNNGGNKVVLVYLLFCSCLPTVLFLFTYCFVLYQLQSIFKNFIRKYYLLQKWPKVIVRKILSRLYQCTKRNWFKVTGLIRHQALFHERDPVDSYIYIYMYGIIHCIYYLYALTFCFRLC